MLSFTHNELAQYIHVDLINPAGNSCLKLLNGKAQKSTVMFSAMIYQMSPINKQPKSIHRFQNFQLSEN